jgi:hypothetical protein
MAWTAAKRKSVQGYTPGLATPYPDATKPPGWRAAVAWLFSADSWPAPVVTTGGLNIGSYLNIGSGLGGANLNDGSSLTLCIAWLFGRRYAWA